jgi:SAM-dependent methyltransferase
MSAEHWLDIYEAWSRDVFGVTIPVIVQRVKISSHYPNDSVWFKKSLAALMVIELEYVDDLLKDIMVKKVPGALAEFGVFEGVGINRLFEATERISLNREIWGFDSFKGLSRPTPPFDSDFWREGMYTCSRSDVERNVRAAERFRIKFVEGFFAESLVSEEATALCDIAFARIDCDLYEPAIECLRYLSPRLSDGAVLVFDDWTHHIETGEARAFAEWVPTVPHLKFEYLFCGPWDHFYIRVWHRKEDMSRPDSETRNPPADASSAAASLVGVAVSEGERTRIEPREGFDNILGCGMQPLVQRGVPLDFRSSTHIAQAYRCRQCGYLFFPQPDASWLNDYYDNVYPKYHESWYNPTSNYAPGYWNHIGSLIFDKAIGLGFPENFSAHESGCSFGGLVHYLRGRGVDATGCELNAHAVALGRDRGNEHIFAQPDSAYLRSRDRPVDVFYSSHALEHMPRPDRHIAELREFFTDSTIGIYLTPNALYMPAFYLGYHSYDWFAFPDHLHLFSPRSIYCMLDRCGFETIEIAGTNREDAADRFRDVWRRVTNRCDTAQQAIEAARQQRLTKELAIAFCRKDTLAAERFKNKIAQTKEEALSWGDGERALLALVGGQT